MAFVNPSDFAGEVGLLQMFILTQRYHIAQQVWKMTQQSILKLCEISEIVTLSTN